MLAAQGLKLACGVAGCLLTGACVAPTGSGHRIDLKPSPNPYEVDLPVPVGFRLVDHTGEGRSSGPTRYIRHRYSGRADKCAVRKFYREQMPLIRWSARSDRQLDGRYAMQFKRGGESCTIEIEDNASRLFPRVTIDASISPWEPND